MNCTDDCFRNLEYGAWLSNKNIMQTTFVSKIFLVATLGKLKKKSKIDFNNIVY